MINTEEGRLLGTILDAQITRNLNNTALIQKANRMPFCKKNIMLAKLFFWDKVFAEIMELLVLEKHDPNHIWNVNDKCLAYLKDNNLSNPYFADFFFNFHEPLTTSFIKKLQKQLNNGMPLLAKFNYLVTEMSELLNISQIELEGMKLSCQAFGGEPICPSYQRCGVQECHDPENIFFVMLSQDYLVDPEIFNEVLKITHEAFKRSSIPVIMIIDYRNINPNDYVFDVNAKTRYDKCLEFCEAVYLYKWANKDNFKGIEQFLIPDRKGLELVRGNWHKKKELTYF